MVPNLEVEDVDESFRIGSRLLETVEYASDAAKEWEKGGFKRYPPA